MTSPKKSPASSVKSNIIDIDDIDLTYEQALAELEAIVNQMEMGNLALDESFNAYKRGAQLLQICQASLNQVEQQVQILTDAGKLIGHNPDNA